MRPAANGITAFSAKDENVVKGAAEEVVGLIEQGCDVTTTSKARGRTTCQRSGSSAAPRTCDFEVTTISAAAGSLAASLTATPATRSSTTSPAPESRSSSFAPTGCERRAFTKTRTSAGAIAASSALARRPATTLGCRFCLLARRQGRTGAFPPASQHLHLAHSIIATAEGALCRQPTKAKRN